ncbi:MAG: DsrE family protein [Candidatus Heimdallarchaeota archaeon]|nr:DsrE family protein [Candidatus Heimdallarchaeota archaeon]
MSEEKLLVITTKGPSEPENVLFPFIAANAALMMDIEVTMFMMGEAVEVAVKGAAEKVPCIDKMPVLAELLKTFIELGGNFKLCGPCSNHRDITSDQLVDNAEIGGASMLVDMSMSRKVLTF